MLVVVSIDSETPSTILIFVLCLVRNAGIYGTSASSPRFCRLCSSSVCSALSYARTISIRTMLTTGLFFSLCSLDSVNDSLDYVVC